MTTSDSPFPFVDRLRAVTRSRLALSCAVLVAAASGTSSRATALPAGSPFASGTAFAANPAAQADDVAAQVDDYLSRLTTCGFQGVAFVAKDGEALLRKAYGPADREQGTPMTTRCVMTTGSLTKQFTGAALAIAMERGLIDLDDSLVDFFDGVPEDRRGIRIRHLLSHTSGLPGAVGHDWDVEGTREHVFDLAMSCELLGPPGGQRRYSNVGYSLLAMILEEVSGVPWEQLLQDELFLPSGMEHTGNALVDFDGMRFPTGYRDGEAAPTFVDQPMLEDGTTWHLRGNGGVLTTIEDLFRWCRTLDGHTDVLSEPVRAWIDAPLVGNDDDGYGFGWGHVRTRRGTHLVEHDGGNGVFNADIHRYVDEGVTLCVMTSVAECTAENVIDALECIVFGHDLAMPPRVVPRPAAELAELAGTYALPGGDHVVVTATPRGLMLEGDGAAAAACVGGSTAPDPARVALANTLLAAVRDWILRGDFQALEAASAGGLSAPQLHQSFSDLRARMSQELGELASVSLLPSVPEDPGAVWIEVRHHRGSWYPRLRLRGDVLAGIGVDMRRPAVPGSEFLPEDGGRFRSFAITAPRAVQIEMEEDLLRFTVGGQEARRIPQSSDS